MEEYRQKSSVDRAQGKNTLPRVTIIEGDDFSALNEKQLFWLNKIEKLKHDEIFQRLSENKPTVKQVPPIPEPIKPEPIKPEPIKTEPIKPEPIKPEPIKPEPIKPEPIKPEPIKSDFAPIVEEKIIPPFRADAPFADNVAIEQAQAYTEKLRVEPIQPSEEPIFIKEEIVLPVQEEALTPPKRMKRLTADEILALHKKDFAEKKFKPSFITVSEETASEETDLDEDVGESLDEASRLASLYYSSYLNEEDETN